MKNIKQELFSAIRPLSLSAKEYERVEILKTSTEALSRMCNQSIYIIDYARQEFFYVSSHPLFLCGYTQEEVTKMGYDFYEKVIPANDLEMILDINRFGWDLFYNSPDDGRDNYCISYDFHLQHQNGTKVMVNHKLSPLCLTADNNIWMAICVVSYSPSQKIGNVVFTQNNKDQYYIYDLKKKKISPHFPEQLTRREEEILLMIMRGNNATKIAEDLKLSFYTVKQHRSNIEKKLGVKNLSNAVAMFYSKF